MAASKQQFGRNEMKGEYLAIDSEFSHGVDNTQEGWDSLSLLANLGLMDLELKLMVFKVSLDLLAVDVVDIQVGHGENTAPAFIAFGQLKILGGENAVKKGKIV